MTRPPIADDRPPFRGAPHRAAALPADRRPCAPIVDRRATDERTAGTCVAAIDEKPGVRHRTPASVTKALEPGGPARVQ